MEKMHDPPVSTYTEPEDIKILEKYREKNKIRIEKLLEESERLQPKCAKHQAKKQLTEATSGLSRSPAGETKVSTVKQTHMSARECTRRSCPKPAPVIHTNSAAILREWSLYRAKEEELSKRLNELEAGTFDDTEYLNWRTEKERKQAEEDLAKLRKCRLESLLSHEAALVAMQKLKINRVENARKIREEADQLMREVAKRQEAEVKAMANIAEHIAATRDRARMAKEKVLAENKMKASVIAAQRTANKAQVAMNTDSERKRKSLLIKKIRAAEAAALLTKDSAAKIVDLTSSPERGLMEEMSIVELKERLALLKRQNQVELDMKRDTILNEKEAKNNRLIEALERIGRHRGTKCTAAADRQHKALQLAEDLPNCLVKNQEIQRLSELLERSKEERLKLTARAIGGRKRDGAEKDDVIPEKVRPDTVLWRQHEKRQHRESRLRSGSTHHPNEHAGSSIVYTNILF
ncbi:unnamed protein product [Calicophoron daubneyi]|uniref:Uncharacterized protein n=1 Tax=Calicophoron daubneyi TaxID=300641 RepID=A0AAV2T854_CALDB